MTAVTGAPPVIVAERISASVPSSSGDPLVLFKDVSFSIHAGQSAAILGRSGSGKTTLLTQLGAMNRPETGSLVLKGHELLRMGDARAARLRNKHIGFVFQSYSLIPHLNVLENVMVPAGYSTGLRRRAVRLRAKDLLEAVGLSGMESARPARLSGGEQQRVAIARSLVLNPSIVLADEPTGALDEQTGESVLRLLLEATQRESSCLVVVTHDEQVAARMDRVFRLGDGQLTEVAA